MDKELKNVAFIPVRGGSKSIKLKNIKKINGRPLLYWSLDAAVQCKYINRVYVCTDSEEIKDVAIKYNNSKVEVIGRSSENSTDNASTESVMLEFADRYKFKNIALIQVTSPLITSSDLDNGFDKILFNNFDSALSVVNQKRFIWKQQGEEIEPINYDPIKRPRRQEFEGFLVENGAFYITSYKGLRETKCRVSGKIAPVIMNEKSYFEIDEPSDWTIVEELMKVNNSLNNFEALKNIKAVLTDSDGVLTDGGMYYTEDGDEIKKYNTRDGMAFKLLKERGIYTGIITGEDRKLIENRAKKLKVDELYMGAINKTEILREFADKYKVKYDEIAYIGDDINDLEVIESVGFGCSVDDGVECVKRVANYVTKAKGGQGAFREVADLIIENRV